AISQLSVFIYVVSFLIMFKLLALESDVFISGFLGIMVATVMAFQAGPQRDLFYIYMTVAGLIPIMILAQNSYFLAYFDELTSLPGRRALNEELMHLRGQYTIAMLDVDHFKSFNDTFGHDVGDQVLKMVASKIRKIGGGGKAFRYGGEEFAVIFPGKTAKQAFPYLSNMRENLDQTHLMIRNKNRPSKKPEVSAPPVAPVRQVHVTISIGLAENVFNFEIQPEEVVKEADQALYRAKQKGRNRISQ
ncbi:MAG: GGDEF domain-containing protein, partial [Gammaproteobacteria bacterium]|nr:GGDEF domain-containing protein [Gammaproteobacteria bacterium]